MYTQLCFNVALHNLVMTLKHKGGFKALTSATKNISQDRIRDCQMKPEHVREPQLIIRPHLGKRDLAKEGEKRELVHNKVLRTKIQSIHFVFVPPHRPHFLCFFLQPLPFKHLQFKESWFGWVVINITWKTCTSSSTGSPMNLNFISPISSKCSIFAFKNWWNFVPQTVRHQRDKSSSIKTLSFLII